MGKRKEKQTIGHVSVVPARLDDHVQNVEFAFFGLGGELKGKPNGLEELEEKLRDFYSSSLLRVNFQKYLPQNVFVVK